MHEQHAAYVRELVFNRQHARWSQLRKAGFASSRLLRRLSGGGEVEAIVLLEHPSCDEGLVCTGQPVAAWRLNGFGLCDISVESFDRLQWRGDRWPFELVRFALGLGPAPIVFINEFVGPQRGTLLRCEAVRTPSGLALRIAEKRACQLPTVQAPSIVGVSTQTALAFLRGDDRALPA